MWHINQSCNHHSMDTNKSISKRTQLTLIEDLHATQSNCFLRILPFNNEDRSQAVHSMVLSIIQYIYKCLHISYSHFQMQCTNLPPTWKAMLFNRTTITTKSPSRHTTKFRPNSIIWPSGRPFQSESTAFPPPFTPICWACPLIPRKKRSRITRPLLEGDLAMWVMWSRGSCRTRSAGGHQAYRRRR